MVFAQITKCSTAISPGISVGCLLSLCIFIITLLMSCLYLIWDLWRVSNGDFYIVFTCCWRVWLVDIYQLETCDGEHHLQYLSVILEFQACKMSAVSNVAPDIREFTNPKHFHKRFFYFPCNKLKYYGYLSIDNDVLSKGVLNRDKTTIDIK